MLPQLVIVLHAPKEAVRTGPVPRDLAIAERIKIFVKMVILGGWALVALKLPSLHASLFVSVSTLYALPKSSVDRNPDFVH